MLNSSSLMDIFKQGMKGPSRPAPGVPNSQVNRYSPISNWNDDPFGDVFEPTPQSNQKKKPPPRPPPPKVRVLPDLPAKPSHFIRKPTVLSSILARKSKITMNQSTVTKQSSTQQNILSDFGNELETNKIFPKCEVRSVQTASLIDLSSPPSSPTFTTRSSSDGLSIDSFGSDATTSTNQHHATSGGNISQTESGFEDDFDMFINSRKITRDNTLDDLSNVDPFSPPALSKPPLLKKPYTKEIVCNGKGSQPNLLSLKGPTIIRAKPARPKPPDNTSILKLTLGNNLVLPTMTVNTTTPLLKMNNGFSHSNISKPLSWDSDSSPERESSPPMPTIPPPPPPQEDNTWSTETMTSQTACMRLSEADTEEPYAIALFDYCTDHKADLSFTANTKIRLLRRENEEWFYGRLKSGAEGLFPANYVEIKVPIPNDPFLKDQKTISAIAIYDFDPVQDGDLRFKHGDTVTIMSKINEEWCFGECNGAKGQFPANYVQFN